LVSHPTPRASADDLTRAEHEVLGALLSGKSRAEIAQQRQRSAATVDHQVDAIYRKLGVRSRSELAARFASFAPAAADLSALTQREREIVWYASLGHSNKLIGYELGLPASTVATHLTRVSQKLGVASRIDLIARVRAVSGAGLAAAPVKSSPASAR
jgi:DNA-binding NarL/FixJ family response regulator